MGSLVDVLEVPASPLIELGNLFHESGICIRNAGILGI